MQTSDVSMILGIVVIVWLVIWLVGLQGLLARNDLEPVTKFMWVFVVVSVPVFGLVFYWVFQKQNVPPNAG